MPENERKFLSDFAKVDAHEITAEEYDEIPELTDEMLDRADFLIGDKLIRRGRPRVDTPKAVVSLRIDQDVLQDFRNTGKGWQTRMNAVLRAHRPRAKETTEG